MPTISSLVPTRATSSCAVIAKSLIDRNEPIIVKISGDKSPMKIVVLGKSLSSE